jgi:hypothetical protein
MHGSLVEASRFVFANVPELKSQGSEGSPLADYARPGCGEIDPGSKPHRTVSCEELAFINFCGEFPSFPRAKNNGLQRRRLQVKHLRF